MNTAIQPNSSDRAKGEAHGVSTGTTRIRRLRTSLSTWRSAGRSNTSLQHSRVASSSIGKLG